MIAFPRSRVPARSENVHYRCKGIIAAINCRLSRSSADASRDRPAEIVLAERQARKLLFFQVRPSFREESAFPKNGDSISALARPREIIAT